MAGCNLIPALNLRSTTEPFTMFFSFARTMPHLSPVLHVKFDTLPYRSIEFNGNTRPQIITGNHLLSSSCYILKNFFGNFVKTSIPSFFITTVSSIRTPPIPGIYTPGSTVSIIFSFNTVWSRADKKGDS